MKLYSNFADFFKKYEDKIEEILVEYDQGDEILFFRGFDGKWYTSEIQFLDNPFDWEEVEVPVEDPLEYDFGYITYELVKISKERYERVKKSFFTKLKHVYCESIIPKKEFKDDIYDDFDFAIKGYVSKDNERHEVTIYIKKRKKKRK